jgi:hypothetical protein
VGAVSGGRDDIFIFQSTGSGSDLTGAYQSPLYFNGTANNGLIHNSISGLAWPMVNLGPTAQNQAVTTTVDTPLVITLLATDLDTAETGLTYNIVDEPGHGALTGIAPDLTYTPDPGISGPDSFTFRVSDGSLDSNLATVSICVDAVDAPASGLAGHWSFDEGSGASAADASGNGSPGVLVGAAAWDAGRLGGAVAFTSPGAAVAISPSDSLNNLDTFSLSMWFFANSTGEGTQGKLITKEDTFDLRFSTYNSKLYFDARRWLGKRGQWRFTTEGGASLLGAWHHLGITYDYSATGNDPVIYLDGALVTAVERLVAPTGGLRNESSALLVGNKPDLSRAFDGRIDDLRIYNSVLAGGEMLDLFNLGSGAQE